MDIIKFVLCNQMAIMFRRKVLALLGMNCTGFEDVIEKIEDGQYENCQEVCDDIFDIIDNVQNNLRRHNVVPNDGNERTFFTFTKEDGRLFASKIKEKLKIQFNEFIEERQTFFSGDVDETLEKLKKRFPWASEEYLHIKALDATINKGITPKTIKKELEKMGTAKEESLAIKSYNYFPSKSNYHLSPEQLTAGILAEKEFYKGMAKCEEIPANIQKKCLKKIQNKADCIDYISFITNNKNISKYNKSKQKFWNLGHVNDNGEVEEQLLFHGTAESSVASICVHNFNLDSCPRETSRPKRSLFGEGLYFSSIPTFSLKYGPMLILCKVLPGKIEKFRKGDQKVPNIPDNYDSREVLLEGCDRLILVAKQSEQILPYCIIHIKKESMQQGENAVSSASTFNCAGSNQTFNTTSQPQSQSKNVFTRSKRSLQNDRNLPKEESIIYKCLSMSDYAVWKCGFFDGYAMEKCNPDCPQKGLIIIRLSKCNHKVHVDCLSWLRNEGKMFLNCPICGTLIITWGNQPFDMTMETAILDTELPGFQGVKTIQIKYLVENGIQTQSHPSPGKPYYAKDFPKYAFLPVTEAGIEILDLLKEAFRRGLVFTVDQNCVTWADISHKTLIKDNGGRLGYPDDSYFSLVRKQLEKFGIS